MGSFATYSSPFVPSLLFSIPFFFLFLFSKFFTCIFLVAAQLKWAWNFLFHQSLFLHRDAVFGPPPLNTGEKLGVRPYNSAARPGEEELAAECAVCLCSIEEGEEIKELRCEHMFHSECLDRWMGYRNATCPLCRDSLVPRRMVTELGEEVLVFRFCSFGSGDRRTMWWLR
ncbi:RING-H2 finger protein ATL66-like [Malania oleifera]|uniref:RING-H2 finger protein ATL66-like n=1 Tax=Malania oleifera TaxID=397392 RepID=UPI0025AE2A5D|nr:RING-H2 finger protein ATL66-like [Malania oleifera]